VIVSSGGHPLCFGRLPAAGFDATVRAVAREVGSSTRRIGDLLNIFDAFSDSAILFIGLPFIESDDDLSLLEARGQAPLARLSFRALRTVSRLPPYSRNIEVRRLAEVSDGSAVDRPQYEQAAPASHGHSRTLLLVHRMTKRGGMRLPGYRSSEGGGLFNSHIWPNSRPQIDLAGGLDALGNATSMSIRNAFRRKRVAQQMDLEQQAAEEQRQQLALEQQRHNDESINRDREFGLKTEAERHRFIEAGGIPAHTKDQTATTTVPAGTEGKHGSDRVGRTSDRSNWIWSSA
jgi:hypothetical protein